MLSYGDKIGIVCCSNGQKEYYRDKLQRLADTLKDIGLQPVFSDYIYEKEGPFSGTAKERAQVLMDFYRDEEIKGIFDISGGDLANGVLPYLDYELIAGSSKLFWGYSDLTTLINAIYHKTGRPSVLYQIRNLIYDHREEQIADFKNTILENGTALLRPRWKFVQQNKMQGIVIGGNIRCFLKLAGTEYMPNLEGKILLLESLSGAPAVIETYLRQLQQLGAFERISGILLGTFTEMEKEGYTPTVETLVKDIVGENMPIAVTEEIGHGTDSKGIVIGAEICLEG